MFDQNATIKETDDEEDDMSSEMISVEPGTVIHYAKIQLWK